MKHKSALLTKNLDLYKWRNAVSRVMQEASEFKMIERYGRGHWLPTNPRAHYASLRKVYDELEKLIEIGKRKSYWLEVNALDPLAAEEWLRNALRFEAR
jgi:hypothetical protein